MLVATRWGELYVSGPDPLSLFSLVFGPVWALLVIGSGLGPLGLDP